MHHAAAVVWRQKNKLAKVKYGGISETVPYKVSCVEASRLPHSGIVFVFVGCITSDWIGFAD
jgi:hypothetical protein